MRYRDAGSGRSSNGKPGAVARLARVAGLGALAFGLSALPLRNVQTPVSDASVAAASAACAAALSSPARGARTATGAAWQVLGSARADGVAVRRLSVGRVPADPPTAAAGADDGGPVIVLDPGHSGTDISSIDPETGLLDHDYPNDPEMAEVFQVAQQVQAQLTADGYTVVLTKASVDQSVSLRQRADIANNTHAALAVSIHDDHGGSWETFAQVYVQRVGLHRTTAAGEPVTFQDSAVAEKSQAYAALFAQARTVAEGRPATVSNISFDGRAGIAPGNIPLVELFATVPWVYNEVGADGPASLSDAKLAAYAQGIIMGVEAAVPLGNWGQ